MGKSHLLFLFLDGIGLGGDDPEVNPLARARMPILEGLLGGERLLASVLKDRTSVETRRASLVALDTCLGVPGLPQSATGQAALLTGLNVPATLGYHYGPKPNQPIAEFLRNGNLFNQLIRFGKNVTFLNAYPPRYFEAITSGRRLFSAIPLAATSAGLPLMTKEDLNAGRALSADFTAEGWRTHLNLPEAPQLRPYQAGAHLAELAQENDFSFFEYWLSDYAGHGQSMSQACSLLEQFDQVLDGLLDKWIDDSGLILITSDHGNMEDLSTRRHTTNPVPAILIGAPQLRQVFTTGLSDLTKIYPAVINFFAK